MKTIEKIFELAREKELEDVSIKIIIDNIPINGIRQIEYLLYVGEKDRFLASSLKELTQMLLDHKESLSWMNN